MKCKLCIVIITAVFLVALSGLATADVLPKEVPENQVFSLGSIVEAVGATLESTSLSWNIGDAGLTRLPNQTLLDTGSLRSGSIGYMTYSDSIMTNGGQISEVKSFSLDTHAKTDGLYNIETAKVLTYTTQNGSHLMGQESYVLDVAGNWSAGVDDIICVFARAARDVIPAFCNKVTASSKLTSVNTAQVQTIGSLRGVGRTASVPAALNYEISVTPDANSASGYADGIFSTTFTVSVMEGRTDQFNELWAGWVGDYDSFRALVQAAAPVPPGARNWDEPYPGWDELASTLTYVDSASVAGGVSTFNKAFSYQSGVLCEYCNF